MRQVLIGIKALCPTLPGPYYSVPVGDDDDDDDDDDGDANNDSDLVE